MSVQTRTLVDGTVVYWVVFRWQGTQKWERSGTDKRRATRLNDKRLAEVKAGTYVPPKQAKVTLVWQYLTTWLEGRKNRTAANESSMVTRHVLDREEHRAFCEMPLDSVRPPDIKRMLDTLKVQPRNAKDLASAPLAPKSVALIAGVLRTMFKDAHFNGLIPADPWSLPRKTISRKVKKKRTPYPIEDVRKLLDAELKPDERMFLVLLLFTGCRIGEVCGRRWRTWDPNSSPLGSLTVDTQYDDQPLKSDDEHEEHPRNVPVHPFLAVELQAWWASGFDLVYCRRPTRDDFIVPQRSGQHRTKSAGYKLWRRLCARAGVENRTVHSTRHTFITLARRNGARDDVLEKVTHNAKGSQIDQYTHWEWEPLCTAVSCFSVDGMLDRLTIQPNSGSSAWTRTRKKPGQDEAGSSGSVLPGPAGDPSDSRENGAVGVGCGALQLILAAPPAAERALDACLRVAADTLAAEFLGAA